MRILFVTARHPHLPGGVERFSLLLAKGFKAKGWQVDFLTGQEIVGLDTFNAWQELTTTWRVGRAVSALAARYDLIISNGSWGAWISPKIRRINAYHGTAAAGYRSFPRLTSKNRVGMLIKTYLERRSGRHAFNVVPSDQVKQEVEMFYRNEVNATVEYGSDLEFFRSPPEEERLALRQATGIPKESTVVLFVGRMELAKGIDCWNRIARRSRENFPSAWFLVVAPKVEDHWRDGAVHYRIGSNQIVVREAYYISDVMFFPSRYESWGIVTVEALACGIPVIGGPIGATAALKLRDPILGQLIVDQWDEDQFYNKLSWYMTLTPDMQSILRVRAREYAEQWSNLERFYGQWRTVIHEALSLERLH